MSAAEPVVVVARWRAAPAELGGVLALAEDLRRRSLEEPGCLGYEVCQRVGEPGTIVLVERYRDGAALAAHRQSAHYRALLVERIVPMLKERRLELLRPCDV